MKRKNYIFSLALALLMGTMTMSLTACSSEDIVANNTQQPAQGEVRTYTVSIPATFSDNAGTRAVAFDNSGSTPAITTKFVEGEKVYVYNNTTSALLEGYLVVKNVSADMKSCELQGQLTGTGTINPDDEVELLYNLNKINSPVSSVNDFYYNYSTQDGTAASCVDGAKATMKVKAIDASNNYKMTFYAVGDETTKTQAKAVFANLQSMFRFNFTDGNNPIKVKTLNIQSWKAAIANRFCPMCSYQYVRLYEGINVTPTNATDDYLYVGLCINEANAADDVLYFCVTDDNDNAYIGTKAAPAGGFENGKYYYSTSPIALEKPSAPTITWTNPSSPVAANASLIYAFTAVTDFDITIANADGKDFCSGYAFDIASSGAKGTIRLHNLNARWNSGNPSTPFIMGSSDFVVELTGTNSITTNASFCIQSGGNLNLRCTGASATLKVTSEVDYFCGIVGASNYQLTSSSDPGYNDYLTTTELDVTSQLAAPGYTVTRSARTDNADGTYTWTYTVAVAPSYPTLSAATTADHGKVVCADGHLHDAKTAVPTGCTAVGILGKVTETGHGLILALKNAAQQEWSTINGWASVDTYASTTLKVLPDADALGTNLTSYTTLGGKNVSNWALAQKSDYEAIFTNLGSTMSGSNGMTYDVKVNAYITIGVGGTEISGNYWSATESAGDGVWGFANDSWLPLSKSSTGSVRPVLGF